MAAPSVTPDKSFLEKETAVLSCFHSAFSLLRLPDYHWSQKVVGPMCGGPSWGVTTKQATESHIFLPPRMLESSHFDGRIGNETAQSLRPWFHSLMV